MKRVSSSDVMTTGGVLFCNIEQLRSAVIVFEQRIVIAIQNGLEVQTQENIIELYNYKHNYEDLIEQNLQQLTKENEAVHAENEVLKERVEKLEQANNKLAEQFAETERHLKRIEDLVMQQPAQTQEADNQPQELTGGEANLADLFGKCSPEKHSAVMQILHTYLDNCSGNARAINKKIRTVLLAAHNTLVDKAYYPQGIPMSNWRQAFPECKQLSNSTFDNTKAELYDKEEKIHKAITNSDLYRKITVELYKQL